MPDKYVICSDCFQRHGLKLMVERFGVKDGAPCPHCGSCNGAKLSRKLAQDVALDYIVYGSYWRTPFGGSSVYRLSDAPLDGECFPDDSDLMLLESVSGLYAFNYGPPLWRVGSISWLEGLENKQKSVRQRTVKKLIGFCEERVLQKGEIYYRLLTDLHGGEASDPTTFDAPESKYQQDGRFGIPETRILYLASNIESAIHECRVTIEDELTLASVSIEKPIKILDLTQNHYPDLDTFDSLTISLRFLFAAGPNAYPITREIAREAYRRGFAGLMYWSYFNQVTPQEGKNLALFGTPITDQSVKVVSIDRVLLRQVRYEFSLGTLI